MTLARRRDSNPADEMIFASNRSGRCERESNASKSKPRCRMVLQNKYVKTVTENGRTLGLRARGLRRNKPPVSFAP